MQRERIVEHHPARALHQRLYDDPGQFTAMPVKQLPRVVITGKSQPVTSTTQTIVQLPRVVIEGRRSSLMALNSATPSEARRA